MTYVSTTCAVFIWRDTTHFDSEDDYRTGCRNVSHCQQQQQSYLLRTTFTRTDWTQHTFGLHFIALSLLGREMYDNGFETKQQNLTRIKLNPSIYTTYKTAVFYLLEQSGHRVEGYHSPDDPHSQILSRSGWAKSHELLHEGVQNVPKNQPSQALAPFLGGGRSLQSSAV